MNINSILSGFIIQMRNLLKQIRILFRSDVDEIYCFGAEEERKVFFLEMFLETVIKKAWSFRDHLK